MSASKWIHYFLATLLPLGSRPLLHQIISLNSANRKVDQSPSDFRLVLVPWHMLLFTQSSLFLISRLPCFILFPLCQRLMEMLYLCVCLKCMNYFTGFMAFWSGLFQASGTFSMYLTHLFNSVSRQHHEVWTSQFPFPYSLKEGIPPVSMTVLIGLWHRLILWVCLSPFLLKGVARSDHGLGFNSQYRRDLFWGLCWD